MHSIIQLQVSNVDFSSTDSDSSYKILFCNIFCIKEQILIMKQQFPLSPIIPGESKKLYTFDES